MTGTAILIGAGPGDPGLLTKKGAEELARADVVIYDRLISPGILAQIPKNAEQIDVGKQSGHHPIPQYKINQLLISYVQAGKRVVRLKGGDPFLFGRGGEELEALRTHHISFEVVPGVTSALAVPAYAGIPVTHRNMSSSVHIITGHTQTGKELNIDFNALVETKGTLIFLMGVKNLFGICNGLLTAGMLPDTPAAIIEMGTTPRQRRLDATVATLADVAVREKMESPAISIFGEVCSLAGQLDWFDALPMKGKRVIITRPANRIEELYSRLWGLGAQVIDYPCIQTVPIVPCPAMEDALKHLSKYEWLAFTSATGVEVCWDCLTALGRDARSLSAVKLAVIGSGTAKALEKHGLQADYIPETYNAISLGEGLAARSTGRVLLLRAEEASPNLPAALNLGKIKYDDIPCYRTMYISPEKISLNLEDGDMVTFTSASTVRGFVKAVGEDADLSGILGICIGPQTASEAKKFGIQTVTAGRADLDALIETMKGSV